MTNQTICNSSKWIDVLRHYGPIPRNDTMYDERVRSMHRRKGVAPISFDAKYTEELVNNFRGSNPHSVILTGTAGDGKTYYCRQVWESLDGDSTLWESEEKVREISLGNSKLTVVKDLSELVEDEKPAILSRFAKSLFGETTNEIFLIAANDGQLIDGISKAGSDEELVQLKELVEELLVEDRGERSDVRLRLYNLSRLNSAELFPSIVNAVLTHPGWQECEGCPFNKEAIDSVERCPILENKSRLEGAVGDEQTYDRLISLFRLSDLDSLHLPIRQQLLLMANMLLGHPDAKDYLLRCKDVPKIVEHKRVAQGSLYSNIFGENLPERRRDSVDVFLVLGRFGIGSETNNRIDNMLIFGSEDEDFQEHFAKLVQGDSIYGADDTFLRQQNAYLEAWDPEERTKFLDSLRRQRQRLFFVVPEKLESLLRYWELTLYHNGGEYLNLVWGVLNRGERVSRAIVSRLVRGLNRIFTGLLANNTDTLVIATSGHYSQAKVSRVHEASISAPKHRGEFVSIELEEETSIPSLLVSVTNSPDVPPARLDLTLTRYEYLCRVADGALPTSFSQECYEDILAFKTRILSKLTDRRRVEEDDDDEPRERIEIKLIELDFEGKLVERLLEI